VTDVISRGWPGTVDYCTRVTDFSADCQPPRTAILYSGR